MTVMVRPSDPGPQKSTVPDPQNSFQCIFKSVYIYVCFYTREFEIAYHFIYTRSKLIILL